ncbi:MAG: PA14 domain-containing protein [Planctomycetota bacterium]
MYKKLICLACFVLVLGFVSNASAELVGHWRFDEGSGNTAHDQSGNGNDGTLINDPVWAIGIINGALQFDGIDDHVNCGNGPSLNVTDAVTIAAWVKLNSVPPAFSVLIAGKYGAYWLEWRDTKLLSLSMFINGAYNGSGPTLDLADGDWHHIALTYDGTHKKGYHNRQEVFSERASGAIDVSGANFLVGEGHPASASYNGCPDGLIDDVRVYNRALTQEEIQLMMRGKGYPLALGPVPKDGAIHENTWVSLGWRAGDFAVSHDVYLGDNFDDVNNGAEGTFQGNQAATFFVAGFPGFAYPDGLVPGTTYYWRIDEVNDPDPNSPWKSDVWSFTIPPKTAYNPVPADGAKFIAPDVKLSWTAGFGAKLHTVYFGDNFNDVNNAVGGLPQGTTTYTPGTLELEKTYYWRVDEFDAIKTYKGDVWSFTTAGAGGGVRANYFKGMDLRNFVLTRIDPQINFNWGSGAPDPAVGEDNFSVRWTGEVEAAFTETYTFYTNSDDGIRLWVDGQQLVNNWTDHGPTENKGTIDLVGGQTYSVVMEMYENGGGAVAELRWSSPHTPKQLIPQAALSLPVKASRSKPANRAMDVKHTPVLTWSPGEDAASHQVYFGADEDAVKNADTSSPEYKGAGDLGAESYEPGKLLWDTTYYWRIDEANNANPDSPWTGNVWSFTTANFLVVDDFEDYDVSNNEIWWSWKDGLGYASHPTLPPHPGNGTGSMVGDETTGSYMEETIVHGGNQSMPLFYDNSVLMYSEVEKTLTYPRDWTENGVSTLTIWFRGISDNAAETLYVALNGSAVVSHDNPNAAQITTWTEWTVDLQAFVDQGVNLANVNTIALGLGNRNNPVAGGSGTMYFDDIRLYPPPPELAP